MDILGVSCFYHDAAACLLRDGVVVAAAEEERFSRRKHDAGFPALAAQYCLQAGGIDVDKLDYVVFYEKPLVKFERIVAGYAATFPRSRGAFVKAMQTWLSDKLWAGSHIRESLGYSGRLLFSEHHVSHAASAFFPSPFREAAVVTADGVGEWATTTLGIGTDTNLNLSYEIRYPHSLGLLYSAFTAYLGFDVNDGEYKVMGMAAYGQPTQVDKVRKLITLADDGSFQLDMRYFGYHHGLHSMSRAFTDVFGPASDPDQALDATYANIAASIQAVTEEAMVGVARRARALSGSKNLCLAGGVALNVLANSRVVRDSGFEQVWVQPASGDSGGCVGAATYLYHTVLQQPRLAEAMPTAYLGPAFDDETIRAFLDREQIPYTWLCASELVLTIARLLADNNVIGWFQGRMEFGPRALGARSILANPTEPSMQDTLNAKIKHRELFRPFAPSTPRETADTFFELDGCGVDGESPFMLFVARVRSEKRHLLPAVTHVDGTARVQTVRHEQNPVFHDLLCTFGTLTGVPVLLNTSFNVRGEPIVCTPEQAFNSFSHTDMDYLVLGNALVAATSKRKLGAYPGASRVGARMEVIV